ncbi:MAG: hypothetical protein KIS62_00145 [Ramlibacter sp.]|nr:hypothetical protein [Ramlibacter sp.]
MDIELTSKKYKSFLTAFRQADRDNAATQAETEVVYTEGLNTYRYFFEAPNFKLMAYNIGAGRVNLTTYNHVNNMATVDKSGLITALKAGGGTGTVMTQNLSTVVALVSEAARSKVVEQAMIKAIMGTAINLNNYEILFKGYNQPARYGGYLKPNSDYSSFWKPLDKEDYRRFYTSSIYTGESDVMCTKLDAL